MRILVIENRIVWFLNYWILDCGVKMWRMLKDVILGESRRWNLDENVFVSLELRFTRLLLDRKNWVKFLRASGSMSDMG